MGGEAAGNADVMGRPDDHAAQPGQVGQPAPAEQGTDAEHGMGLSSEHDQGEVQEVDSREQD